MYVFVMVKLETDGCRYKLFGRDEEIYLLDTLKTCKRKYVNKLNGKKNNDIESQ